MSQVPNVKADDIPMEIAVRAYAGTSHVPSERGAQEQQYYVQHMQEVWDQACERAETEEERAWLSVSFEQYRQEWVGQYRALLVNRAKLMSSFITGPAKFPVERHRKISDAHDKKIDRFNTWHVKARKRLLNDIREEEPTTISSDDPEAVTRINEKIKAAELYQKVMKIANSVIRKKNTRREEVLSRLREVGLDEKTIFNLLTPDFAGRVGFAPYQLSNNLANIKRMKSRVVEVEQNQASADKAKEGVFEGGTVLVNQDIIRLQILFDSKPEGSVRTELKKNGFRWAPSHGAWQRQWNDNARYAVKRAIGVEI